MGESYKGTNSLSGNNNGKKPEKKPSLIERIIGKVGGEGSTVETKRKHKKKLEEVAKYTE